MKNFNLQHILNIVKSPKFLSTFSEVSQADIDAIERQFSIVSSRTYSTVFDIESASLSEGLVNNNFELSLKEDWGVELSKDKHSFVSSPNNIRIYGSKFLVSNQFTVGGANLPCFEVDLNLNFKGTIGKIGTTLASGQYQDAVDIAYSERQSSYYIVSKSDNIVHRYNAKTKQYIDSIGDGTAGAEGTVDTSDSKLSSPISMGIGDSHIFILCNQGSPAGSTGNGFLAVYSLDGSFKNIPIYHGKNGGSGYCFEGEISEPKDIFVTTENGREKLYILNGNNEIGIFDTDKLNEGVLTMLDVLNLPSDLGLDNPGLERIYIDSDTIYTTSRNTGKVIAISKITGELIGYFGRLADESASGSDKTLGYFNGLSGVVVHSNKIHVAESLNNRIQVFGKSLITSNMFEVVFTPQSIPGNMELTYLGYSLAGQAFSDIRIIDLSTGNEIDIQTAINKKITSFKVKVYIDPMQFSQRKSKFRLEPLLMLMENYF